MAQIFVTGRLPIETSNDKALRVDDLIRQKIIGEWAEVDGNKFKSKSYNGIKLDPKFADREKEYDLNDQVQKEIVRSFERDFEAWKAKHPEIKEWQQYHYLEAQGVIKMGEVRPEDTVLDIGDNGAKFRELKKKFSSLQTLKYLREKAQSHNDPDYEAKRIAMFNRMKKNLFGGFAKVANDRTPETKTNLADLEAQCKVDVANAREEYRLRLNNQTK